MKQEKTKNQLLWTTRWPVGKPSTKNAEPCFQYLIAEVLIHGSHISLAKKYLYVETAKVACSTIKKILRECFHNC